MSKRAVLITLAVLALVGFISLRHYLSPGEVVKRKFIATIEAFEEERLLALMSGISRDYSDPWGLTYETFAGYMSETMETYDDLMKGTQFGPMVIAGDALGSNMLVLMEGRADPSISMPHGSMKPVPQTEIDTIRRWIEQGAKNN